MTTQQIRSARPSDLETLVGLWLRSVRATHAFLTEDDIQGLLPQVQEALASGELDLWVLCTDGGAPIGFMGMSGNKIEALFLAPEHLRAGGGRRLVQHARSLHAELTVDVNEQNPGARMFYAACGFKVEGRSELDGSGRPFPLLHLRWP